MEILPKQPSTKGPAAMFTGHERPAPLSSANWQAQVFGNGWPLIVL